MLLYKYISICYVRIFQHSLEHIAVVTNAEFPYCCSDCLTNAIQMDWATWAIWAAVTKYILYYNCLAIDLNLYKQMMMIYTEALNCIVNGYS